MRVARQEFEYTMHWNVIQLLDHNAIEAMEGKDGRLLSTVKIPTKVKPETVANWDKS